MDLQKTILKVLKEETKVPLKIKRRQNQLRHLLFIIMKNQIICGVDEDDFINSVLDDVDVFMIVLDINGLNKDEVKEYIKEHMLYFIKAFYQKGQEDC